LNNVNAATTLAQDATTAGAFAARDLSAKGGFGDDDGSEIFDAIIAGLSALASAESCAQISNIAPLGDFDEHPNSTLRLWLGPLGASLFHR